MRAVRWVAVRALLDVLGETPEVDHIVVCTDHEAKDLPEWVLVVDTTDGFHLGRMIRLAATELELDVVVAMGGASCPLATPIDFSGLIRLAIDNTPAVVTNNPLSADVVAISPASVPIDLPATDNFIPFLLQEAGYERIVARRGLAFGFDIDTPTDLLLLERFTDIGPVLRFAISRLPWDRSGLDRLISAMNKPWAELCLIGRVSPAAVTYVNERLNWRTRVLSEERGMKALGRDDGRARSLIADYALRLGPSRLFAELAACCDGCLIDSRVIFGHGRPWPSAADRYLSDLGMPDQIKDDWVRSFTEAAMDSAIPVVLGGHTIVSGGLTLIVDHMVAHGCSGLCRTIEP